MTNISNCNNNNKKSNNAKGAGGTSKFVLVFQVEFCEESIYFQFHFCPKVMNEVQVEVDSVKL